MIKNLTIECEQIVCTSAVKRGEDNSHIKMTLEDVRSFELMTALIEKMGVNEILDHISDDEIRKYLDGGSHE